MDDDINFSASCQTHWNSERWEVEASFQTFDCITELRVSQNTKLLTLRKLDYHEMNDLQEYGNNMEQELGNLEVGDLKGKMEI